MKNILFLSLILSFASCKKNDTPVEDLTIEITSIEAARIWKGGECAASSKYYQHYLANNAFRIKGKNLRTIDNITLNNAQIDVKDFGFEGDDLIVITESDIMSDFQNPVRFVFDRLDDEVRIESEDLRMVGDIAGHAFGSNLGYILDYLQIKKYVIPEDFLEDFEAISGDYEPKQFDVIFFENKYWLILDKVEITANAFQRKYQITCDTWDCNGTPREETIEFVTNFDKGIVSNSRNITKFYTP